MERINVKTGPRYTLGILALTLLCIFSTALPAHAGAGTFTLVQHVNNTACPSSSTTCPITLSQSISAGDLLIFESTAGGSTVMTASDNGGTFVQCASCVGFDNQNLYSETSGGWILSAAAESSTITVTFNSANGGGVIEMWEYSYSGGTPGFDGANQNENQNSASPTAATFTPSGSNDISVQACRTNFIACDAVSSPFLGDNLGNYEAWAYLSSPTNWTAPTWTLASSGLSQLTQLEFGFGVSPCANTMAMEFPGTNGTPISLAQLASGTFGWQGGQWMIGGAAPTFATSASQPLQNLTGRLCDGSNNADTSTTGMQFSTTNQAGDLEINGTGGILSTGASVSAGVWYYSNLPATDNTAVDDFAIFGNGDYVNFHEFGNGANRFGEIECFSGTSTGNLVLVRNTWYWVEIVYNTSGNHTMKFYNNANPPVQVGSTLTCPANGAGPPAYVTIGIQNPDQTLPSGYVFNYDSLLISLDGIDPLLPTGPSPTPTFTPAPGTYSPSQTVTLSDANPSAVIYYTTNGTTPTTNSSVYSEPIQVTATSTIEAIAAVSGYNNSYVANGTYTILPQAPAPTFNPPPGNYSSPQSVSLSDANSSATIYYTTNNTMPTTSSPVYSSPIQVSATTTIQAIAVVSGDGTSPVAIGTYTISVPTVATPTFSPAPGTYSSPQSVALSDATTGATIYYTTDGVTPTTSSPVYNSPIPVDATTTIEAIAVKSGYNNSAVASGTYTISAGSGSVVNLSGYYNIYGIATVGNPPRSGGFDNDSYAYNSATIGTSATYQGLVFTLGPANAPDAVSSQTVALSGPYNQLYLLGAGVNGAQTNQTIVVTYTDGTTSTFTQSFSDWANPQGFTGETTLLAASNRIAPNGQTQSLPVNVYGYTFELTAGKILQSVKLPHNRNVVVLGVGVGDTGNSGLRYIPVAPCRVADTRNANGPFGGPMLSAGSTRSFAIPNSACNIPATAQAYALNFTVVPPGPLGSITVWPTGQDQPGTILLTSFDGRVKANAAIVAAGTSGGVSVYTTQNTNLVIDITGYFVSGSNTSALEFYPVSPCRTVNPTYLPGAQTHAFSIGGTCGVPSSAQAYSVNITVQPTNGPMNVLYAWPAGQSQPTSSTLNAPTGTTLANTAIVGAGTGGQINLLPTNNTNVVIDINGYYAPAGNGGLSLYPFPGCRILNGYTFNQSTVLNIEGSSCNVPAAARDYILNATISPSWGYTGYMVFWANGVSQPGTSSLNDDDGSVMSNGAIVSTTNGYIDAYAQNQTSLYLDINGYFAP
jgi:hypothetical protein